MCRNRPCHTRSLWTRSPGARCRNRSGRRPSRWSLRRGSTSATTALLRSRATPRSASSRAEPGDLAIAHQAYDGTDALRDSNLVFPPQRLRELEAEGVIGRVAQRHYGVGLVGQAADVVAPGQEAGRLLKRDQVDLVLFVPA